MSLKGSPLSISNLMIILRNSGKSHGDNAQNLHWKCTTVQAIIKNFIENSDIPVKYRSGRPKKFSDGDCRGILKAIASDSLWNAQKLAQDVADNSEKNVRPEIIRRVFRKSG